MSTATTAAAVAALVAGGVGGAFGYALGSGDGGAGPAASPSPFLSAPDGPSDDDRRPMSEAPTPTPTSTDICGSGRESQRDLDACAGRDLREAEALLARVFRAVRAGAFTGEDRAALDRSQRQWRDATDTLCGALADDGGTIAGMNATSCAADAARDRARELCEWASPNADEEAPAECRDLGPGTEGT